MGAETIRSTLNHPFYVPQKGFTNAVELRAGDVLLSINGDYVIIEKIQHEILESPISVYNFRVANDHTYYVGSKSLGVHNASVGYGGSGSANTTPKVDYKGEPRSVYRGGNSFEVKPGEVKFDANGNVRTSHGVSLDVNPGSVDKFGGAYEIKSIPDELQIIQRGGRPEHFEIVPKEPMPLEQFQELLNQIIANPYNPD